MGNGTRESLSKRRRIDRSIAHNDVASAREIGGRRGAGPRFLRNWSSGFGKFTFARKRNPGEPDIKNGQPLSVELKIIRL
jgi:hypothetical protein